MTLALEPWSESKLVLGGTEQSGNLIEVVCQQNNFLEVDIDDGMFRSTDAIPGPVPTSTASGSGQEWISSVTALSPDYSDMMHANDARPTFCHIWHPGRTTALHHNWQVHVEAVFIETHSFRLVQSKARGYPALHLSNQFVGPPELSSFPRVLAMRLPREVIRIECRMGGEDWNKG